MNKFKVGDKVYYPARSNKILILKSSRYGDKGYPLELYEKEFNQTFTINGNSNSQQIIPFILHATTENYELLSKLYPNVEFEKPSVLKEPKEVIKAMLESGWKCVPCMVSDIEKTEHFCFDFIRKLNENGKTYPFRGESASWKYAIPFDPKTGKIIIDFVDGKIVTE